MISVPESSKDTGPMLPGFETCKTATARWPTPNVRDYKDTGENTDYEKLVRKSKLAGVVAVSPTLTSSVAVSPASPSAMPASERENPIAAGFGLSSTESFARFNPDGSLSKMCQGLGQLTLDGSFEEYSGTFPKQGLMRSGWLYPLPMLERPTSESESSLWPTVTAQDAANDAANDAAPSQWKRNSAPLNVAVKWPTPRATDSHGAGKHGQGGPDLRTAVKWPTPTKADGERGSLMYQGNHNPTLKGAAGGQLNPTWVEWLMGFPLGWTDLEAWATPSSRRSRK